MTNPVGYEGEPITLTDGRTVHVKYGMKGLMRLEDAFGSLGAVQNAVSSDGSGPVFSPAMKLLACGLLHEKDEHGAGLSDPERLADHIDPARFQEAVTAAGKALGAAFPQSAAQDAAVPEPAAGDFPGPSGTTPPASSSDAPTTSSGA